MHLGLNANTLNINLINGRTHFIMFNALVKDAKLDLDKGNNFMFLKVKAKEFYLNDCTNYP